MAAKHTAAAIGDARMTFCSGRNPKQLHCWRICRDDSLALDGNRLRRSGQLVRGQAILLPASWLAGRRRITAQIG